MKSYLSVYRIFLFVLGILGITLQVLDDGVGMFMYYTILSNLLVVLFLLFMILKKGNLSDAELRLRDGTAMSILITCVVYHFMLAPTAEAKDYYNLENFICHYILPIGFILDSLFSERFATKNGSDFLGIRSGYLLRVCDSEWTAASHSDSREKEFLSLLFCGCRQAGGRECGDFCSGDPGGLYRLRLPVYRHQMYDSSQKKAKRIARESSECAKFSCTFFLFLFFYILSLFYL